MKRFFDSFFALKITDETHKQVAKKCRGFLEGLGFREAAVRAAEKLPRGWLLLAGGLGAECQGRALWLQLRFCLRFGRALPAIL
jgi:hypothetical protein